jgi:Holliday junction DNA helicase RuvB
MEANIKVVAAPMIEKSGDLAAILTNLQEGDILFIDEIHRLKSTIEEVLYPAMEDYRLDLVIGSGPAAQTIKIDIEKFTLIGATTRAGMISNPLRDRFGMNFRLQFYNDEELSKIIQIAAEKLNKKIQKDSALEIAKRSRGTPRIALRLLKRVRDFSDVAMEDEITFKTTKFALEQLGVNENGFDELDLSYLNLLCRAKKPLGLSTISAALSEDEETIEDVIEPFLLANGYVERTARGRIATRKSYQLLNFKHEGSLF